MLENLKSSELNDDTLDTVVGGMGMERNFEDLPNGKCKCIACGKILEAYKASAHAKECVLMNLKSAGN